MGSPLSGFYALTVVVALVSTQSCLAFLSDILPPSSDLVSSQNPFEVAAHDSKEAAEKHEQASKLVEEAFEPKTPPYNLDDDIKKLEEAKELRPLDPLYDALRLSLLLAQGGVADPDAARQLADEFYYHVRVSYPHLSPAEARANAERLLQETLMLSRQRFLTENDYLAAARVTVGVCELQGQTNASPISSAECDAARDHISDYNRTR